MFRSDHPAVLLLPGLLYPKQECDTLNPHLQDRYEGALLGAAVGDALGAGFISWHFVSPESFLASTAQRALHPTVATEYLAHAAVTVLESDDRPLAFMLDHLRGQRTAEGVTSLISAARRGTWMSHRSGCFSSRIGVPRDLAAVLSMPAILLASPSDDACKDVLDGLNHMLGGHERRGPSLVFAALLHGIIAGRVPHPAKFHPIKAAVEASVPPAISDKSLALVEQLLDMKSRIDVMNHLKASQPFSAVPAALWALTQSDSYTGCVYAALSIGQETNANAMLTGALAGALVGAEEIPDDWLHRLPSGIVAKLRAIGHDLYQCALSDHSGELENGRRGTPLSDR